MNAYTKPFREDLGLDDAGFHRILMGKTVYSVKNNVIYTLSENGQLTQVDESILTAKPWIRRNVDEVLGKKEKFKARFVFKSRRGYVIEVNGVQYTARASTFSFSNLLVNDNGLLRAVTENEVSHPEFQRVFKACLNARLRSERTAQHFAMDAPVVTAGSQYRKRKALSIKRSV